MDFNDILFIIIWVLSILLIIHFSHKIITFVTENFDTDTTTLKPAVTTSLPTTTSDPNINEIPDFICSVNKGDCPLASVLSNYPNIKDKWGNEANECVKVIDSDNAVCANCPPGTFIDYSNVNEVCTKCPPGKYSDKNNSLSCKPCREGSEEGQDYCESETTKKPDLFDATQDNDKALEKLYKNEIKNYQQFQTLNSRLNRLSDIMNSIQSF
mgnify:CR=1 FL=1|tara:strand:- start:199 stop:834 length:636 start_codon:yes stop_codon:yes gene_type:complete